MKDLSPSSTNLNRNVSLLSRRVRQLVRSGCVYACCVLAGCVISLCVAAWCTPVAPIQVNSLRAPLAETERRLRRVPAHISEFNPVSEPLALPRCGNVRPPEALLTPDPLLQTEEDEALVRVSFIVGSDGHVHSAFVLNGAGPDEDAAVLRAVRQWRYRPALCNGVPTDAEARVRFILH